MLDESAVTPTPGVAEDTPFGRYLLQELMARGGMGEVFRAVAKGAGGFERPVVVKRILPQLAGWKELSSMFIEEARLMSRLLHPNIVQVIDFGKGQTDDYFLVMELVEGVDLGTFFGSYEKRGERVPVALALHVAHQLLRGLHHAHTKAYEDDRTLVHRDVSPGNVLLSCAGEVKVADFGVAQAATPGKEGGQGGVAGKPSYMPPEQFRGEPVDARADVFAVAVVLFQLLTGEMPFAGEDGHERQRAAAHDELRDASELRDDLGGELVTLLSTALASDPEKRFVSARAMAKAIESLRDADYEVASSDDLADVVEVQYANRQQERRVVPLAGDTTESASQIGELTRTGGGEFTMHATRADLTEQSVIRTAAGAGEEHRESGGLGPRAREPTAPSTEMVRPAWVAPALAIAVIGVGVLSWRVLADKVGSSASSVTATGSALDARSAPMPSTAASEPQSRVTTSPQLAPSRRASATPHQPLTPTPSAPVSSRAPSNVTPTPAVSAEPPEEPPPRVEAVCTGTVRLTADVGAGTWWVSGGPGGRVQAPGVYTWPCNNYALSATSRVDGHTSAATVAVMRGGSANAHFR